MIVSSKKLLEEAKNNKKAIPQFNINNLEWTKYILEACNQNNYPVILGITENVIKYVGGYKTIVNMIESLDDDLNITVPVVIHLDHGKSFNVCKNAVDAGFTSVMIDASSLNIDENIKLTKQVVEYASKYDIPVEAELGSIGDLVNLTDIKDAKRFVTETKINSFAPAIGNVHGIYQNKPNIDIKRCKKISEEVKIPLVLHGASGIDNNTLKEIINNGITKVNINTDLQIAWAEKVRKYLTDNKDIYDPRKIISSGEVAIKEVVTEKINILKNIDKNL